jgi:hypothetical protein
MRGPDPNLQEQRAFMNESANTSTDAAGVGETEASIHETHHMDPVFARFLRDVCARWVCHENVGNQPEHRAVGLAARSSPDPAPVFTACNLHRPHAIGYQMPDTTPTFNRKAHLSACKLKSRLNFDWVHGET